ncbi:hypothetical protein ACFQ4K_34265 [Tistrella bauzanensis]
MVRIHCADIIFSIDVIAYLAKVFIHMVAFLGKYGFYAMLIFAVISAPIVIILGVLGQARMAVDLYRLLGRSIGSLVRLGRSKAEAEERFADDPTARREPRLEIDDKVTSINRQNP